MRLGTQSFSQTLPFSSRRLALSAAYGDVEYNDRTQRLIFSASKCGCSAKEQELNKFPNPSAVPPPTAIELRPSG